MKCLSKLDPTLRLMTSMVFASVVCVPCLDVARVVCVLEISTPSAVVGRNYSILAY
jgi:hypothetical protein